MKNIDFNEMLKQYKPLYLCIDTPTYEAIDKIAKASFTTRQKITYTLIQTAMMYNFNSNFEYICCKTQNMAYASRGKQVLDKKIKIYLNNKYLPVFDKIKASLCTVKLMDTVRSLVTIALEYDYTEKLMFSKPDPIDLNNYAPIGNSISDFIMLDII